MTHPARPRRAGRRAGLTLFEIVISMGVLSILALALIMLGQPITRGTTAATLALEMDGDARSFFAQLRRDLRASGFEGTVPQYTLSPAASPAPVGSLGITGFTPLAAESYDVDRSGAIESDETFRAELAYRRRTGPTPTDWSGWTLITSVPDGSRRIVQRVTLAGTVSPVTIAQRFAMIGNVSKLLFRQDAGSDTIVVVLVLERTNPQEPTGPTIRRLYVDRVELLNPASS